MFVPMYLPVVGKSCTIAYKFNVYVLIDVNLFTRKDITEHADRVYQYETQVRHSMD